MPLKAGRQPASNKCVPSRAQLALLEERDEAGPSTGAVRGLSSARAPSSLQRLPCLRQYDSITTPSASEICAPFILRAWPDFWSHRSLHRVYGQGCTAHLHLKSCIPST
eukprot:SM000116S24237  [mRNA]  locus=s116:272600:273465:+ [translate_table: standard]